MPTMKGQPPETIYLQCYDEYDSNLLGFIRDDVTWCRDRINDNDAVYILATPELAELLDRLAGIAGGAWYPSPTEEARAARILAARIRDSLA